MKLPILGRALVVLLSCAACSLAHAEADPKLLSRGYSDEDVLKIAGRNHLSAMREMERISAMLRKASMPSVAELPAMH